LALQRIINKERGPNFNENPWQGRFVVNQLTDRVEEAVYKEFEDISERGGVLGAMDTLYQRGKIQEESPYYAHKKHDGSLPLVGVNTYLGKDHGGEITTTIELIRSTEEARASRSPTSAATSRTATMLRSPLPVGEGPGERVRTRAASPTSSTPPASAKTCSPR
jgi:methylmalonyl-CoA mutase